MSEPIHKHTPGPWKVVRDVVDSDGTINLYVSTDAPNINGFKPDYARSIVKLTGCAYHNPKNRFFDAENLATTRANARLIAAAPMLLEALKECLGIIDQLNRETYDQSKLKPGQSSEWAEQVKARAAIAKAEGREPNQPKHETAHIS